MKKTISQLVKEFEQASSYYHTAKTNRAKDKRDDAKHALESALNR
jgi:hypothetical protein